MSYFRFVILSIILSSCFIGDRSEKIYIVNDTKSPFYIRIRNSYFDKNRQQKIVNKEFDSVFECKLLPGDSFLLGKEINSFKIETANQFFQGNVSFKSEKDSIALKGDTVVYNFVNARIKDKSDLILYSSSIFKK